MCTTRSPVYWPQVAKGLESSVFPVNIKQIDKQGRHSWVITHYQLWLFKLEDFFGLHRLIVIFVQQDQGKIIALRGSHPHPHTKREEYDRTKYNQLWLTCLPTVKNALLWVVSYSSLWLLWHPWGLVKVSLKVTVTVSKDFQYKEVLQKLSL